MAFKAFPLLFWLWMIEPINRTMPFLVKMSIQPSSYDQHFSRIEILGPFCPFWGPKWNFYRVTDTRHLFSNKRCLNDAEKLIWRLLQFFQGFVKSWLILAGLQLCKKFVYFFNKCLFSFYPQWWFQKKPFHLSGCFM